MISSNWISDIKEDTTSSTDVLDLNTIIGASSPKERSVIITTQWRRIPLQPHETILPPTLTPGVPDPPIIPQLRICSITDQLDSMIDLDILRDWASIKDAPIVRTPSGGVDGDGQRADVSNVLQNGVVVVAGKHFVAADVGR